MGEERDNLIRLLRDLDETAVLALVRSRLEAGDDPLRIMEECQEGVRQVGLLYEEQRYFVSGLIMAGEILRQVVDLIGPVLEERVAGDSRGTVVLGTVQGDIHDIGKNLVHMLLRCNGFTVVDLGVDVAPEAFVARVRELKPAIVGLSGLLTTAAEAMRDTIALLRSEASSLEPFPVLLVGGGMVDERVHRFVGADHWADDAIAGLRLCQRLAGKQP